MRQGWEGGRSHPPPPPPRALQVTTGLLVLITCSPKHQEIPSCVYGSSSRCCLCCCHGDRSPAGPPLLPVLAEAELAWKVVPRLPWNDPELRLLTQAHLHHSQVSLNQNP